MYLLRLQQVLERTSLSRSGLYELLNRGDFPKPVKLVARSNGWPADEVEAWIKARMAAREASTPSVDSVGDVVEPLGMQQPVQRGLPFLWQHDHGQPIAWIESVTPSRDAVRFTARLAKIDEPGALRDRLEEAYQSLRSGLVRGVSIGFAALKAEPLQGGGRRFTAWRLMEISAVTLPANADASVETVKFYAERQIATAPARIAPMTHRQVTIGPVASAALAALKKDEDAVEKGAMRANPMHRFVSVMGAGFRQTDAEIAQLEARITRLEEGR